MGLRKSFTFMTWNLYLGADLSPLFLPGLPQRVTEVFRQFLATNFPERVNSIADLIVSEKPDIIGLQEVARLELIVPGVTTVTYDFLELLQEALLERGLPYAAVAINENFQVDNFPTSHGNFINFLDRDVILVREGSGLNVIAQQSDNFETNLTIPIGGQPVEIVRGWSFIDVMTNGQTFRVINTHLDPDSPFVQIAQGNELLTGPANTTLPIILLGDLNSNADGTGTPTYQNFLGAGFGDVWLETGSGDGFTAFQDADLLNALPSLSRRIDFILYKNGWDPNTADVVGEEQSDRTSTALWPSDHAGVIAALFLTN